MPSYKLVYFNGRGRAETIRLVFAAAGIKYEDKRIEKEAWGALKPSTPWGALPILEVDGKAIGQSIAITRFVAKEAGLAGKTNFEQALVDSAVDTITELREALAKVMFTPDGPVKDAAAKDLSEKTLPTTLTNLDKFLGSKNYLVGDKLTLADIHFFSIFEGVVAKDAETFKDHAKLKALYDRVAKTPKIAEYIKKRPETPF